MVNEILQLDPRDNGCNAVCVGYNGQKYIVMEVSFDGELITVKGHDTIHDAFTDFASRLKKDVIYD